MDIIVQGATDGDVLQQAEVGETRVQPSTPDPPACQPGEYSNPMFAAMEASRMLEGSTVADYAAGDYNDESFEEPLPSPTPPPEMRPAEHEVFAIQEDQQVLHDMDDGSELGARPSGTTEQQNPSPDFNANPSRSTFESESSDSLRFLEVSAFRRAVHGKVHESQLTYVTKSSRGKYRKDLLVLDREMNANCDVLFCY